MNNEQEKEITIKISVIPSNKTNSITIEEEQVICRLKARPIRGQANKALIKLLSRELGVPQQNVQIIHGIKSQIKYVKIRSPNIEELKKKLNI